MPGIASGLSQASSPASAPPMSPSSSATSELSGPRGRRARAPRGVGERAPSGGRAAGRAAELGERRHLPRRRRVRGAIRLRVGLERDGAEPVLRPGPGRDGALALHRRQAQGRVLHLTQARRQEVQHHRRRAVCPRPPAREAHPDHAWRRLQLGEAGSLPHCLPAAYGGPARGDGGPRRLPGALSPALAGYREQGLYLGGRLRERPPALLGEGLLGPTATARPRGSRPSSSAAR